MNWVPNRKVASAGAVGMPLAVVVSWGFSAAGVEVPAEVASAMGALLSTVVAYIIPEPAAPK